MASTQTLSSRLGITKAFNFIDKRSGPFDGEVSLTRDRVYILPTRMGLLFGVLLLTLLIGSINYEKSLGFMLTFLLAAIGNLALLTTWQNIAGLTLRAQPGPAVFCGEDIRFTVQLINDRQVDRHSLVIGQHGVDHDVVDCAAGQISQAVFRVKSKKRGLLQAGRFRLHTQYPTGLFTAWTSVDLSMQALVYPAPSEIKDAQLSGDERSGEDDRQGPGQENYSHLRKYHFGDKPNLISWKAAARTDQLFTKSFTGTSPQRYWIDWDDIRADSTEHRLSIMTGMVLHAHENNHLFGLRLPTQRIDIASGRAHYHRCLSALALY